MACGRAPRLDPGEVDVERDVDVVGQHVEGNDRHDLGDLGIGEAGLADSARIFSALASVSVEHGAGEREGRAIAGERHIAGASALADADVPGSASTAAVLDREAHPGRTTGTHLGRMLAGRVMMVGGASAAPAGGAGGRLGPLARRSAPTIWK